MAKQYKKTPRYKKPAQFMREGNKKHYAVRTYLTAIAESGRKQEALKESIERENAKRYLQGMKLSDEVITHGEPDLVGEGFTRLQEKIDDMNTELIGYVDVSEHMRKALFAIAKHKSFDVIWNRYFLGMTWQEVAERCHVSERTAFNLHDEAIALMYEHLPREYRQNEGEWNE